MTRSLLLNVYVLCCLVAVTSMLIERRRSYYRTHERWRDAPRAFVETCVEAILMGLGVGLGIALVVLSAIVVIQALTG